MRYNKLSNIIITYNHKISADMFFGLLCDHNNKDAVNSPNILNDNDYQAPSQKSRQIRHVIPFSEGGVLVV